MPKILEKYCYIDVKGEQYILHTQQPFLIGRMWLYKDIDDLTRQIEKLNPLAHEKLNNYAIAVTLWTVLGGRLIVHGESERQAKNLMQGMLNFFQETKMKGNESKFAKYLI